MDWSGGSGERLEKARPIGLRLAIPFRTFGRQRSDVHLKHIEVEWNIGISHLTPKVLGFLTDLEAVSP